MNKKGKKVYYLTIKMAKEDYKKEKILKTSIKSF